MVGRRFRHGGVLLGIALGMLMALAGCGGGPAATFTMEITGILRGTLASPDDTVSLTVNRATVTPAHILSFNSPSKGILVNVVYYGKDLPESGTFTLSANFSSVEGTFTATVVNLAEAGQAFTMSDGSITLEKKDGAYSGSFSFEARGGGLGEFTQTITITGTFSGVRE
ncbi:MAG: hypothetical protein JNM70_17175 [Anaerolineae bacterium]|nr:hypothetical protein [Anaerolineae bacterium]